LFSFIIVLPPCEHFHFDQLININDKLTLEALQLPLLARHEVSNFAINGSFKFPNLQSSRFFLKFVNFRG
jgi:hypothetical protein